MVILGLFVFKEVLIVLFYKIDIMVIKLISFIFWGLILFGIFIDIIIWLFIVCESLVVKRFFKVGLFILINWFILYLGCWKCVLDFLKIDW